uniref:G-type lectin S-receptor-like serine/threonine-protein kinase CES101 n=1 Tax=Zeugodacus cucurbitae TaxID=28588 RepID=A0A0A1XIM5_ZEUCU
MAFLKIFFVIVQLAIIAKISDCQEIDRCEILSTTEMKRICTGKYPAEIWVKYNDGIMKYGAPYAIFQFIDSNANHYFVTHFYSPLIDCVKVMAQTAADYDCTNKDGITKEIHVNTSTIICITENLHMIDELLVFCAGKPMKPSEFVVLQYNFYKMPTVVASNTDAVMFRMHPFFLAATISNS